MTTSFAKNEAQVSKSDVETGGISDLTEQVKEIASTVAPEVSFGLDGKIEKREDKPDVVHFTFTFENGDGVGLFLGKKMSNLKLLFDFIDLQQIIPHDNWVRIHLDKGPDGEQHFADRDFNVPSFKHKMEEQSNDEQ